MSLSQYLVRVHCCGSRWLIEVPAVGRWTTADDKKAIADTARAMIAGVTEASTDAFRIDLAEGRVLGSTDEFAAGAARMQRWHMAAVAS
ncbi:hypothetical protein [Nocardia wallacei]|uniref:Uncharacterized protein n=1 Tax=Nocardia wallacei TaxID=480035 RepID=A0A7G1KRV6_9NOCA|nr:hypothetical protein [Nocardia wallacei]BCK57882.1 hypothetical protein NWFMUON74_56540 [Nocardia wallacei]